jgi:hypothetical protein
LLAHSIINEWGISGQISDILNSNSPNISTKSSEEPSHSVGKTIRKLCEIGEALARANDPEHYPCAEQDWTYVKCSLEDSIGIEGIKTIQERVRQNSESYAQLLPEMFQKFQNINPDTQINEYIENSLLRNNQFVKHCNPRLRKRFKQFYSQIRPGEIARNALSFLIKDIIPFAGFNGGYIYTFDPSNMTLVPRTKIGSEINKEMFTVSILSENPKSNDPVSIAMNCSAPIVQRISDTQESSLAFIVGAIGSQTKVGVLYLELPNETLITDENNCLVQFKAIRQALDDCFHV